MKTTLKISLITILVIVLVAVGFFANECYQYAKAVQNDAQRIFKKSKDYILGLSFDGVIVEKTYNIDYYENQYSVTILLHQVEPKPLNKIGYYTYYNFISDSLLTICIPQNVYNQIEIGEEVIKKANDYNIEVGEKKMLILSSTEKEWLP